MFLKKQFWRFWRILALAGNNKKGLEYSPFIFRYRKGRAVLQILLRVRELCGVRQL